MGENVERDNTISLGFRRLCSDMTLQSKQEGFFKDYLATIADEMSDEQFEQFKQADTDEKRILYMWTLEAFHKAMAEIKPVYKGKSSHESNQRREQGNSAFKNRDFKMALAFYNQSVIYSPYGN